jgi:hypothetical protein
MAVCAAIIDGLLLSAPTKALFLGLSPGYFGHLDEDTPIMVTIFSVHFQLRGAKMSNAALTSKGSI